MGRESEQSLTVSYHLSPNPWPHSGKSTPVQKGLLLSVDGNPVVLCEEGVGFGVPILQYKRDFYFPGSSTVSNDGRIEGGKVWKSFIMNLIDRHQRKDSSKISMFSWVAQRIYNRIYKSSKTRKIVLLLAKRFGIEPPENDISVFLRVKSMGTVLSSYLIDHSANVIHVTVDFSKVQTSGLQHMYISNELGGSLFNAYTDSSGVVLQGDEIGGWDRIRAAWAEFQSPTLNMAFRVEVPEGVEAFRGREIIGKDICWSGVIFMLPPLSSNVEFKIEVRTSGD
ncbi:MAG: hypothetical protein ACFFCP_14320 [Promethearchaeota archaeon]